MLHVHVHVYMYIVRVQCTAANYITNRHTAPRLQQ